MRILDAFKAFFAVLGGRTFPAEVPSLPPVPANIPQALPPVPPDVPGRSEAITLLAALQRESRLVDFLMESLDGYSDAQVGAAARSVHNDAAKLLRRFFDLQPLVTQAEESPIEIPEPDPGKYLLSGNVSGSKPIRGILVHAGWKATCCELPSFQGNPENLLIVAPAEIEIR